VAARHPSVTGVRHPCASRGDRAILRLTVAVQNLQIFGTKKCQDTRKAERFFKERGVRFHLVDLGQKPMSAGELRNVASRVGGMERLIDREGKRYHDRGLHMAAPTGPRVEQALADDPLLLRTPIVRCATGATVGFDPDTWTRWLA
jgi:arsenate reductase (glutaredoxin)